MHDDDTRSDDTAMRAAMGAVEPLGPVTRADMLAAVERELFQRAPERVAFGRYVVRERLGAGAQGVVYAAEDPQLGRRVAVKLVRARAADPNAGTRLLREAQALARLAHPNVVAINDVGVCEDGVYLVTELVDGEDLAQWLRRAPAPREVLRALIDVGRGLAAVHEAGLVHRDVKPTNILVGRDGRLRLADFGLARHPAAAAPDLAIDTSDVGLTATGAVVGTPAYMAPEQHAGTVGPAADQYAYCVTLFEALAGARPFRGDTIAQLVERKRSGAIEPAPRRVPQRWLAVVSRGLRADPGERWPTMQALVDALERASERRWPMRSATFAIASAAIVTMIASTRPIDPVAESTAISDAPVDAAARAALDRGRELAQLGRHVEAAAALEQAFYGGKTAGDDRAALLAAIDLVRVRGVELARADEGKQWVKHAEALMPAVADAADAPVLAGLLAHAHGHLLGSGTQPQQELALQRRALELLEPALGDPDARVAEVWSRLGIALARSQAFAESTAAHERALAIARAALGDDHPRVAELVAARAGLLAELGRWDDALAEHRAALALFERARGPEHPANGSQHAAIAGLLATLGRTAESEAAARRALALADPTSPDAGQAWHYLGMALGNRGAFAEAIEAGQRGLAVLEATRGPDHPSLATVLGLIGWQLALDGRARQAIGYHQRAVALRERALGPDDAAVAESLLDLGHAQGAAGDYDDAWDTFTRAHQIFARALGDAHATTAYAELYLGKTLRARGDARAAAPRLDHALTALIRELGADHPNVVPALAAQVEALVASDQRAVAEARLAEVRARVHTPEARTGIAEIAARMERGDLHTVW